MICRYCNTEMILEFCFEKHSSIDPFEEWHICPNCKATRFYSELNWHTERWVDAKGNIEIVDMESGYVEKV